jgi:C1A family cysteine protease
MVYGQTQAQIDKFNSLYGEYYTAGHNQFSHLTLEEWKQQYLGSSMSEQGSPQRKFVGQPTAEQRENLKKEPTLKGSKEPKLLKGLKVNAQGLINSILPKNGVFSIDYSLPGRLAISPVKNQGECGSCWAFAGIGEIESFFMARHKMSLDLSEQQMVDCVTAIIPQTLGCGGGQMDSVHYYAAQFPIATEKYYPYTGNGGSCNKDRVTQSGGYKINSYTYVSGCQQMTSTILNLRPFAVCG